jgi:hypothetical protein
MHPEGEYKGVWNGGRRAFREHWEGNPGRSGCGSRGTRISLTGRKPLVKIRRSSKTCPCPRTSLLVARPLEDKYCVTHFPRVGRAGVRNQSETRWIHSKSRSKTPDPWYIVFQEESLYRLPYWKMEKFSIPF